MKIDFFSEEAPTSTIGGLDQDKTKAVVVSIAALYKPELTAANAVVNGRFWIIHFSENRKVGLIMHNEKMKAGDSVIITGSPGKVIGHGVVIG